MYKVKAASNTILIIKDLNIVLSDNRFVEIEDKAFENSIDLNKVKKYLIIEKKDNLNEVNFDKEIHLEKDVELNENNIDDGNLNNKIFVKDLDNIDDNIEIKEEQKYEKFIANYDTINLNDNIEKEISSEDIVEESKVDEESNKSADKYLKELNEINDSAEKIINNIDNNILLESSDTTDKFKNEEMPEKQKKKPGRKPSNKNVK